LLLDNGADPDIKNNKGVSITNTQNVIFFLLLSEHDDIALATRRRAGSALRPQSAGSFVLFSLGFQCELTLLSVQSKQTICRNSPNISPVMFLFLVRVAPLTIDRSLRVLERMGIPCPKITGKATPKVADMDTPRFVVCFSFFPRHVVEPLLTPFSQRAAATGINMRRREFRGNDWFLFNKSAKESIQHSNDRYRANGCQSCEREF
jgi:hypothetical protein